MVLNFREHFGPGSPVLPTAIRDMRTVLSVYSETVQTRMRSGHGVHTPPHPPCFQPRLKNPAAQEQHRPQTAVGLRYPPSEPWTDPGSAHQHIFQASLQM
ncbi:hypothetical protein KOW79_011976 [Hemibagrus wyckioides]|uniref:Uncharacterized protein n=1 Tax=Hemibagrus wyckioides TaxID=337641 RepID=A0A9D3SHD6_9TELE|nr:hypothetical protein KOW79_011976 [Hemibagrus wyckioides]